METDYISTTTTDTQNVIDSDNISTFTYDDEGPPDTFNLAELRLAVRAHFGGPCTLKKLAQGGYHKVYEVLAENGMSQGAVVRVANAAFPGDKMRSEVATMRLLAAHTKVPVARVYHFVADACNPVGAEYMIMEKVAGVSIDVESWKTELSLAVKENVVAQVARHLAEIFTLRFDKSGSLYETLQGEPPYPHFKVGPSVGTSFYRALDGVIVYPNMSSAVQEELQALRGPFVHVADYLSSSMRATLLHSRYERSSVLAVLDPDDEENAERLLAAGERALRKAIELCHIYPGDHPVDGLALADPTRPFTLLFDDFRLPNIMFDPQTGNVHGFIDFEGAVLAPLWESADVPSWIPDPDSDMASWYGGSQADQRHLWATFHDTIKRSDWSGEWHRAYEHGRAFRRFAEHAGLDISVWGTQESWIDARLDWALAHPGIGKPDEDDL